MMLSDFLDADDLSMLEEKPLVAEKNEGFKNMLRCQAVTGCLVSAGISLLCVPSTFCCERIYQGSSLVLDANKIEFSQPTPSACVLANLKRTVPLENITDVTVRVQGASFCLFLFLLLLLSKQATDPDTNKQTFLFVWSGLVFFRWRTTVFYRLLV
jgi:hypothetical protein